MPGTARIFLGSSSLTEDPGVVDPNCIGRCFFSKRNFPNSIQWLFLVPLKGGRDYIIPQLAGKMPLIYIPLIVLAEPGGLYNPYHLLGEPETAIDRFSKLFFWGTKGF